MLYSWQPMFSGVFLLQPDCLGARKKRLHDRLFHCLIHSALLSILYQEWANWQLPLAGPALLVTIDTVKQRCNLDTAAS